MSILEGAFLTLYGLIVISWVVRHVLITKIHRELDVLTMASPTFSCDGPPLVTALIPARDEEDALPSCLDSVRAQTYPNLEIIVADDRSADGTRAVCERAAASDPRVRVVAIEDLPPGWTGKSHALHVAAREARGRWLWFLDADTLHSPESLSIMMEYARSRGALMASLLPASRCESFWERVLQPLEGIVLMRSYPLADVNRDDSKLAFANGQYILIARNAYEEVGGHEAVRSWFVEDIHLARRVKAAGHRIRCAVTTEISSTRMYTSLGQMVRGWGRILYDALDREPKRIAWKIVEPLIFSQSGDLALLVAIVLLVAGSSGAFAWGLLVLSLIHQGLKQSVLVRMYAWSAPAIALYGLLYPLAGWLSVWISLRAIVHCLTGRVQWRGTDYGQSTATNAPLKTGAF